ncbi:hypothetical protein BU24DRAFT_460094 [Aaosphaeria arxii CBS 175.79]|uniref:Uncharacterized protein n=1 Tax=Aaosphaeria arxii CBS 175.79 TaxID=1450172 RepID=A0A6A5XXJ8_9PLEO|nr:uncharacterized protein BU24DRAFT_460094 [Aaosphaeria arxii CBS 175.79]KAF2016994.1 hypothetical protein BU24DRAFT_460094 [Aaosphaeria arxii CBS 175.79]
MAWRNGKWTTSGPGYGTRLPEHDHENSDNPRIGDLANDLDGLGINNSSRTGSTPVDTSLTSAPPRSARSRFFGSNNIYGSLADNDNDDDSQEDLSPGIDAKGLDFSVKAHGDGQSGTNAPESRDDANQERSPEFGDSGSYSLNLARQLNQVVNNKNARPNTNSPNKGRDSSSPRQAIVPYGMIDQRVNTRHGSNVDPSKKPSSGHSRHPGRRGYTAQNPTSNTWHSQDAMLMQEFIVLRNSMRRLFKHSDVAKWKHGDYLAHKQAQAQAEMERRAEKTENGKILRASPTLQQNPLDQVTHDLCSQLLAGLHFQGNISLVLGLPTIWCENWTDGKEEIAPWPSIAELKWEGDDRAKTNVGRYPPIPREMGAPGIVWSQLQMVEQYPLDQVSLIPTMEDIYAPIEEIEDEVKYDLIPRSLEIAIEKYLES